MRYADYDDSYDRYEAYLDALEDARYEATMDDADASDDALADDELDPITAEIVDGLFLPAICGNDDSFSDLPF